MITYKPATGNQYQEYFQLMLDHMAAYIDTLMVRMDMTVEQFAERFRTVGQVYSIIVDDEDEAGFYWIEARGHELHLHGIIITEQFQGQGIGTATLNMLEEEHKDTKDYIELGVHQGNTGAIKLYQQLGYRIFKSIDELGFHIMRKSLSSQY